MIREAASAALSLSRQLVDTAQIVRGFFYWRSNYIVRRWVGDRPLADVPRIAVFVQYDRRGRIHDYVIYYLNALLKAEFEIVCVSNSRGGFLDSLPKIRPLCGLILQRKMSVTILAHIKMRCLPFPTWRGSMR
jgi:hypothetical protein